MLLLDEPFGALDARVRKELRRWLRRLHDEIHLTSVFVTHDQEEALEVADRIVVFNKGRIEQVGTPDEVYDQPATLVRPPVPRPREPLPGRSARGVADIGGAMRRRARARRRGTCTGRSSTCDRTTWRSSPSRAESSFPRRSSHTIKLGPVVRLELTREESGEPSKSSCRARSTRSSRSGTARVVHLKPRRARVFIDERQRAGRARGSIDDREVPRVAA